MVDNFLIYNHDLLLLAWGILLFFLTSIILNARKSLNVLSTYLNSVGVILLLWLLICVGASEYKTKSALKNFEIKNFNSFFTVNANLGDNLPDIYYIILDEYARDDILKEYYNFDNSKFINYLKSKGFYVASKSRANYLKSEHSLASSLNMEYINYLNDSLGENYIKRTPINLMLQDYQVWRFLKAKGYTFIHLGSFWQPTSYNKYADINYNYQLMSNFSWALFGTTAVFPISRKLGFDYRQEQWQRVYYKFNKLANIPEIDEPTFAFAHMIIPHPPFVFDNDGNFLTVEERLSRDKDKNYLDQLIFINKKISELIEKILRKSDKPPVIILQSDHGIGPLVLRENPEKLLLKIRTPILNAYYLDDEGKNLLYETITPVNSFRIIFNYLFDTDFELLPDESYFSTPSHPYKFIKINDN